MNDRRILIVPAMFAAAAACLVAATMCSNPARGAERRYEIVLFEKPLASDAPDRPRIYVISEAYDSKERCLQVLASVKVKAPNARAKCLPKED